MLDLFQDLHKVISEDDSLEEGLVFSDSELALDESPDLTEVQQVYHNLVDIINFLFRITMAIRQSSGHDQFLGVKIGDILFFEPRAKQHVLQKYPGVDDYIVDRLRLPWQSKGLFLNTVKSIVRSSAKVCFRIPKVFRPNFPMLSQLT